MSKLLTCEEGIWDYFTRQHLELGPTVRSIIGPECAPAKVFHYTTDPTNVEHVLKTNFENYGKGPENAQIFEEFLGKGIFAVDGDLWRSQRKIAASIFSRNNFSQNMTHVFQVHARRLVHVLRQRQHAGEEVDLQRFFFSLTLDAFSEIGLGYPWNSLEEDVSSGQNTWRQEWARHFDSVQAHCVLRFAYRPFWKLERLLYRCGLLPNSEEAKLASGIRFMNAVMVDLVEKRRAERADKGSGGRSDLLSLFMDSSQDAVYLRDMVINFVIAGRDTTACTLTWLFWELGRRPAALATAQEEVLREAGEQGPNAGDLSFETLKRLKFCTACVRETVRLHPPVPVDAKVAFKDDVLPDRTLVSAGDMVFFMPYQMARDTKLWGLDAGDWRPDRWLEMKQEPSQFVNCAFQAGPRICLGREMAVLEAKAVLAQFLLAGIAWEVRPDYVPMYRYPSLVLPMADPGLPVQIVDGNVPESNRAVL